MFHFPATSGTNDRYHVEAHRTFLREFLGRMTIGKNLSSPAYPILLAIIDCEFRRPEGIAHASFHFDEHQRVMIHHYNVYLGACGAKVSRDDLVASPLQMTCRQMLASLAVWQPAPCARNRIANPQPQVVHRASETAFRAGANTHLRRLDANNLSAIATPGKRPRLPDLISS
jgi:hypothetical protein